MDGFIFERADRYNFFCRWHGRLIGGVQVPTPCNSKYRGFTFAHIVSLFSRGEKMRRTTPINTRQHETDTKKKRFNPENLRATSIPRHRDFAGMGIAEQFVVESWINAEIVWC